MVVLGARPQFIKTSIVCSLIQEKTEMELDLIHTGQHYDYELSRLFFDELKIPEPSENLGVGSGTHAEQTSRMMIRLEQVMSRLKPDIVLVPGDTNSTLAGALTGIKMKIPVCHIESGCRSRNMAMPEEVNRVLTDHCSMMLFAPSVLAQSNLREEGIKEDRIYLVGDTMFDVFKTYLGKASKSSIITDLNIETGSYLVVTAHRPSNVDNHQPLSRIVNALVYLKKEAGLNIIFVAHPRTLKNLDKFHLSGSLEKGNIRILNPIGYLDMLKLMQCARLVITDSGGIQKEAYWLHVPCLTLRNETEWSETIQYGANRLVGNSVDSILRTARMLLDDTSIQERMFKAPNPYGDGCASHKIVTILENDWEQSRLKFYS